VNQAIGRVIRHKRDFGAILLCDTRFGNAGFKQQLSAWLQPHIKTYAQFGVSYKAVIDFFKKTVTLVRRFLNYLEYCQQKLNQFPESETKYLSRQPANRGGNDKEELKSTAAVGFSQAVSRKVYKKVQNGPPPDALSTSQITSDILNSSAESPMAPSPLVVKREIKKAAVSKGLFSAMHNAQPEHVINFDENVKVRQF
jgi:Helicase C-terminal domain